MSLTRIGFIGASGIAGDHLDNLLSFSDVRGAASAAGRARQLAAHRDIATFYSDHHPILLVGEVSHLNAAGSRTHHPDLPDADVWAVSLAALFAPLARWAI